MLSVLKSPTTEGARETAPGHFEESRQRIADSGDRRVIVQEYDPLRVFSAAAAGMSLGRAVFLFNPNWGAREKAAALEAVSLPGDWVDALGGSLLIPTGGTSGELRFAVHTPATLTAAARGFADYFDAEPATSVSLLPPYHVSGLMPWWRAAITGGQVDLLPAREPWRVEAQRGGDSSGSGAAAFISLTPTQLARWLDRPEARKWLRRFDHVLVGGGPVWPDLLAKAIDCRIFPVISYGATETAAMVAAGGADGSAGADGLTLLPHARIRIVDDRERELQPGAAGRVAINSPALFAGYWPGDRRIGNWWLSDDIGKMDTSGRLHLLGRGGDCVISGGENIYPAEIEAALRGTGLVTDVFVTGVPDPDWGEALTAFYVPSGTVGKEDLAGRVRELLAPYKVPKNWVQLQSLERSPQGKVDRRKVVSRWKQADGE